ncbi:MAG: hypothetical protein IKM28_00690 [Lachnospiraceae bacterium]|nr:hypothetical protein [Lachnospiraceae bacterium]
MRRKKGIIEIILQSDLCMGSGYSYAGIIDSDICYDAYGIPYIPARRLKGCFREAAESILSSIISEKDMMDIFGETGANGTKGIILDNAYIDGYEEVQKEIGSMIHMFPDDINAQEVLDQFTQVKAQTRLVDGVAEDLSLRFTRVVNQYTPEKEQMKFKAEVFFEDDIEGNIEEKLSKIVKATRNIGLMRNRGMGSVKCTLSKVVVEALEQIQVQIDEKEEYVIQYVLTNKEPLMLSGKGDDCSEPYISGKRVLGFLAKKYLEKEGHTAEDAMFVDLFLNGETKFTHAYPYRDGKRFCPAPAYINRLKKTKKLVNTYFTYDEKVNDTSYNPDKGNQPKKLKGKFISIEENRVAETTVDMSIIYHHSHTSESRGGDKGILYSTEAIQEEQMFSGYIYVSGKYAAALLQLLTSGEIRLGKSITAQYGKCILAETPIYQVAEPKKLQLAAGTDIVVRFLSDTIFVDEVSNDYSIYSDVVIKLAAQQLGIEEKIEECPYSPMFQTKLLYGYQSVWNLRKQPVPAIEAGGCLVYRLKEAAVIEKGFLGERNQEGFGEISIEVLSGQQYEVVEEKKDVSVTRLEKVENNLTQQIIKHIAVKSMLNQLRLQTMQEKELQISKAALGRVTLMLKESLEENKDNSEKAFQEFVKRIQSIKTKSVREEIEKNILKKIAVGSESNENDNKIILWKLKSLPGFERLTLQKDMLMLIGWDVERCRQELNKEWGNFLLFILVQQKYRKKR